jgi:hypothetical protein
MANSRTAGTLVRLIRDRLPHLAERWPQLKSFLSVMEEKTAAPAERMRG